jgi:general stress protein YciG
MMANNRIAKRGFASMDPAKRLEVCSKGGKAAQEKGVPCHRFNSETGRLAGLKGGGRPRKSRH